MSYAKFDDRCDEHPKIASLSDRDFRAWFQMVLYCARNLTDGLIPAGLARQRWGLNLVRLQSGRVVESRGTEYYVHDYLDWNDSRETVLKRRERSARGAAARNAPSDAPSAQQATLQAGLDKRSVSTRTTTTSTTSTSAPTSTRAGPAPSANGHERDEMFEILVQVSGWDLKNMTTDQRGQTNKAAKQLREAGASPGLILGFGVTWDEAHPDIPIRPQIVVNHWADYMANNIVSLPRGRR